MLTGELRGQIAPTSHSRPGTRYNANQIRFIHQIIDYLTQNGVMDPGLLYEQPFTDYSPRGLDGLFSDPEAADIVSILAMINKNAGWAGAGGYSMSSASAGRAG